MKKISRVLQFVALQPQVIEFVVLQSRVLQFILLVFEVDVPEALRLEKL
jgi:hypothetical protein